MKKNIIIILLIIISLVFGFTSLITNIEVDRQRDMAEQFMIEAERQAEIAMMYVDSATLANDRARISKLMAERAMEAKLEAEDKLKECK